ncbi:hypothetical protein HC766_05785 [Candidatus Gracilibacteria bacterium]|nr:hypothetical protein [Candidatus Gracilibacteria bacterium]NJS41806.1 hypothetical protein [Candidatus Gracilibacteria bacterium]
MSKQILFIGQALPATPAPYPFARSRLYKWFASIQIDKDTLLDISQFNAVLDYFPGKYGKADRAPNWNDILENRERLYNLVQAVNPHVIVGIGKIATQALLYSQKPVDLKSVVGTLFQTEPFGLGDINYDVVILPHPSGLSTWVYQEDNMERLNASLKLIASALSIQAPQ